MNIKQKPEGAVGGGHTYIDRDKYLNPIAKKYGRNPAGLCLKISYSFFVQPGETLETCGWGGSHVPVRDCAMLQNICYWHGLAPRVYSVDIIDWEGKKTVAQLQDYVGEGEPKNPPLFKKVCNILREYGGYHVFEEEDGGTWNSAGGKWVGFKGATWKNKNTYALKIAKMKGINRKRHMANFVGNFNADYES